MNTTNVPEVYKPIAPYIKIAQEFKERDPVLHFWIINYAVEQALAISNAPEVKGFLVGLLDELEASKKAHAGNESFTQGTVAQCHVEAHALRLFQYADEQDRNANFNKNMLRAFFTAAHLFDVLTLFGADALDEKMQSARKYAKWKATYINTCMKKGETPKSGPPSEQTADFGDDELSRELMNLDVKPMPQPRTTSNVPTNPTSYTNDQQPTNFSWQQPPQQPAYGSTQQFGGGPTGPTFNAPPPPQRPDYPPQPQFASSFHPPPKSTGGDSSLTLEDFIEARKLTKLAASALDYEDAKTAVDFLRKAIKVLEKPTY